MSGTTGALAEAVGMGLLHFTWIGLVMGAFLAVVLAVLRGKSPRLRYGVALGGFALLVVVPIGTFYMAFSQINWAEKSLAVGGAERPISQQEARLVPTVPSTPRRPPAENVGPLLLEGLPATNAGAAPPVNAVAATSPHAPLTLVNSAPELTIDASPGVAAIARERLVDLQTRSAARLRVAAPWLAAAWLAGVLFLGLRLLGGVYYTRALRRRGTSPLAPCWQSQMEQLRENAGVRNGVRVFQSTLAGVPVVVGWLRPVILMPASIFTGLPAKEVELLLAHELAHIKRLDPLVNLLQVVAETVLFFHPVVWWLSRRIREERELCCDDFAVALCGGRADYARALLHVAERCAAEPRLALSAAGGPLRRRINRILGVPGARDRLSAPGVLGLALLTLCGALITGLAWAEFSRTGDISEKRPSRTLAGVVEPPVPPQFAAPPMSPDDSPATFVTSTDANTAVAKADLEGFSVESAAGSEAPPEIVIELAMDGSIAPDEPMSADAESSDSELLLARAVESDVASTDTRGIAPVQFAEPQPRGGAAPSGEAPVGEMVETPDAVPAPEVDIASADPIPDLRTVITEVEADTAPLPVPESAPVAQVGVAAPYPQGDPETVERLQRGPIEAEYGDELVNTHLSRELSMLRVATGIRFLLDANTVAPPAQGFRGGDAPLGAGYATDGVLTVPAERASETAEAWLKELTTPLGLSYLVYPDTVIVSTPERLAEIAAIYQPRLHNINARYYRVSDPELVQRLKTQLDGDLGAAVFPVEDLLPEVDPEPWTRLEARAGVSLLANHAATVADNSFWWHDDPADSRHADAEAEPHRLYSFAATEHRDNRGCGGNLAGFGAPVMIYDASLPSAMAPIGNGIQMMAHHAAPILFNQIVDLNPPRPKAAERRASGRRAQKGEGQDRPERSKWYDASGIAAAVSVRTGDDAEHPEVSLCIQQNLFHWDLAKRGEWQTLESAGRFLSPTYVYAWPTYEAGIYAMALVHVERSDGDSAGTRLQTALAE